MGWYMKNTQHRRPFLSEEVTFNLKTEGLAENMFVKVWDFGRCCEPVTQRLFTALLVPAFIAKARKSILSIQNCQCDIVMANVITEKNARVGLSYQNIWTYGPMLIGKRLCTLPPYSFLYMDVMSEGKAAIFLS